MISLSTIKTLWRIHLFDALVLQFHNHYLIKFSYTQIYKTLKRLGLQPHMLPINNLKQLQMLYTSFKAMSKVINTFVIITETSCVLTDLQRNYCSNINTKTCCWTHR